MEFLEWCIIKVTSAILSGFNKLLHYAAALIKLLPKVWEWFENL